eukprot:1498179-Rhodomonas_salina.2
MLFDGFGTGARRRWRPGGRHGRVSPCRIAYGGKDPPHRRRYQRKNIPEHLQARSRVRLSPAQLAQPRIIAAARAYHEDRRGRQRGSFGHCRVPGSVA